MWRRAAGGGHKMAGTRYLEPHCPQMTAAPVGVETKAIRKSVARLAVTASESRITIAQAKRPNAVDATSTASCRTERRQRSRWLIVFQRVPPQRVEAVDCWAVPGAEHPLNISLRALPNSPLFAINTLLEQPHAFLHRRGRLTSIAETALTECLAANLGLVGAAALRLLFLLSGLRVDAAVKLILESFSFHASACERNLVKRLQSETALDSVAAIAP